MEFDVTLDVKLEEREVTRPSQKTQPNGHVGETECSDIYDDLERHRNEVKKYELQFESKRHKAEADQERQRQKNEEERQKKEEVKDKWDKILRRGAYKELPKKNKKKENKKSGKQDPTSLNTSTSERAREETQDRKKKKRRRRKQNDRIFQDNRVETPQRNRWDLLPTWFIITSLIFWYFWTYRTIFGLCLFLGFFSLIFSINEVDARDEAGIIR